MKRGFTYRWGAVVLALGLVLAACSSDEPVPADADEGSDEQPEEEPEPEDEGDEGEGDEAEEEAPSAEPSRTILEAVLPTDPVGLNPFPQTAGNMAVIHLAMYMSILTVDENQDLYSEMLESWDVAADGQTITLNVQPGLEWNDGTPVTAADVEMSLAMHLDPNISSRATRLAGVVGVSEFSEGTADSIAGLSTPDDMTVVIELAEPDAAWLPNFASLMRLNPAFPAHILGDVPHAEIPEHPFFETHPVTNGPYQFVEYVPEQYVELERNENWSGGEAGFERLFFKIVTDAEARVAQLQSGELQFIDGLSPLDVDRLSGVDGITIDSATGLNPNIIGMAYDHPLLEDPRVRQAIVFAIDREGLCTEAFRGFCSVSPTNQRLVGLEWALPTAEDGAIVYDFDPDRARELLAEAGWDESDTLNLLFRPGGAGTAMTAAMSIVQAQLADVGIDMEIVNVDVPTLLDRLGREGRDPDSHLLWNAGANFSLDPSSVQPYSSCGTRYPDGPNLTWYCVDGLDDLWVEGRRVIDQDARAEIYKEAFLIKNQDPDNVNLVVLDNIVAHDSRLKGVKPIGDIWQSYWNIGQWTWED